MRIAVIGGTGRIGGRVARLLADEGRHDVVALSRRIAPYDDPEALRKALDGADTLVFVSGDGEAARVVVHHAVTELTGRPPISLQDVLGANPR